MFCLIVKLLNFRCGVCFLVMRILFVRLIKSRALATRILLFGIPPHWGGCIEILNPEPIKP